MALKEEQNSETKIGNERNRLLDVVITTATLAFVVAFLSKCADDFDCGPRIPLENGQKLQTAYGQNADLIIDLSLLRNSSLIFENKIYVRPQFCQAPGLEQSTINSA